MNQVSNFMGKDGFNWFVGVVEDRNDPSALGRVRVRCLGYHSSDLTELPTVDLPWAHVMHPVTDPSMHGRVIHLLFLLRVHGLLVFFVMLFKDSNLLLWEPYQASLKILLIIDTDIMLSLIHI